MGPPSALQRERNATVRYVPNHALFPLKILPHIGPQKTFRVPSKLKSFLLGLNKYVWRLTQGAWEQYHTNIVIYSSSSHTSQVYEPFNEKFSLNALDE